MVCKFFYKRSKCSDIDLMPTQKLADELHKPITTNLTKEEFILHLSTLSGVLI